MPIELEDRGQALENEYFRRKEQELIAKMKEKLAAEEAKPLSLKCPKCEGSLFESELENVRVDVCDKCSGVWLDAGEIAQIVDKEKDGGWFGKLFG
jgi:acetyl-CoA carboxylase beta subunit